MIIATDSTTIHDVTRLQLIKSLVQAFSLVLILLHLKLILADHTLHINIITLLLSS